MASLQFRPRLIPAVGTLCLLALFLYLGQWQAGKARALTAQLEQLAERSKRSPMAMGSALVEAAKWQDAAVRVRGQFESDRQIFVDNRQENGVAGLHVVTPLKIEGSETRVLVNRGWVAWPHGRQALPVVGVPPGVIEVLATATVPSTKPYLLMPEHAEAWPNLWPRVDLQKFQAEAPYKLQPVVLLQSENSPADGLLRHWPPPEDRVGQHVSYAWQWRGMALALVLFFVVASVRRVESS